MMADQEAWRRLLADWRTCIHRAREGNLEKWEQIGLPPVEGFEIPNSCRQCSTGFRDKSIASFYDVVDGWPIWLGSNLSRISSVPRVALFADKYPQAYKTAIEGTTDFVGKNGLLSLPELESALVLTEPDARDFVLALESGRTVLYGYVQAQVFDSFFEFMVFQKRAVEDWVAEMLSLI